MNNRVFVITGAAGSGKTTVRDYLHDQYKMARVITHTTRAPRAYERDGVDYYFEDDKSFFLTTIFWNRFTMPAITMVHRMKAWKTPGRNHHLQPLCWIRLVPLHTKKSWVTRQSLSSSKLAIPKNSSVECRAAATMPTWLPNALTAKNITAIYRCLMN